jgi:hypothetical protein
MEPMLVLTSSMATLLLPSTVIYIVSDMLVVFLQRGNMLYLHGHIRNHTNVRNVSENTLLKLEMLVYCTYYSLFGWSVSEP